MRKLINAAVRESDSRLVEAAKGTSWRDAASVAQNPAVAGAGDELSA
jgi:hypothetical protein